MTQDEVQKLVQSIFDHIFNSITQALPGEKPVSTVASTVLSLMKPGIAIRSRDFRNPWSPGNMSGSQEAAVNTADLVDAAPKMSTTYINSGFKISTIYKQILDGVNIPAQPANPAIEKQLTDAESVLHRTVNVTDPDTGEVAPKQFETQLFRDYNSYRLEYQHAKALYTAAFLDAQQTTLGRNTWPLVASTYQLPVRSAYDKWRSAGADRIEQALAIQATSNQNALQLAWADARLQYDGYLVTLGGLVTNMMRSTIIPSDWHSETASHGWTDFDSGSSNIASSYTSDYTSYGGSAGFSLGFFSIGGSAGHSTQHQHVSLDTNNVRISFKYALASIYRPWLMFNLLGTRGWNLGNLYSYGELSTGTKTGQENSAMPLLPTSFVVVKDVYISANWSQTDWDLIKSKTGAGGGFGIGPFTIGGSYSHSSTNETFQSSLAYGKIKVPGVQIIGVISQVVPLCPPV